MRGVIHAIMGQVLEYFVSIAIIFHVLDIQVNSNEVIEQHYA